MTPAEVLDIGNEAIFILLKAGAPILGVALVVGLMVSLFQALTQMQEMTLSFVPKVTAMAFTLLIFLPYIMSTLVGFGERLFERVAGLG
ncbi:MAG: flagellar biosynthesis protein FliQ [Alphaproteobacteria bacterium]|jgi:flagellar biosynthetic protein FliQ